MNTPIQNNPAQTRPRPEISSFALRLLAMGFMLCDHLWGTSVLDWDWLTCAGRLALPLFAFLLAEGFFRTSDRKKYTRRFLLFALLTELPFNLMMGGTLFYPLHQNVLWTFLLALLLLRLLEKIKTRRSPAARLLLSAAAVGLFYLLGLAAFVDYYGFGILTVVLFYFTRPALLSTGRKRWLAMGVQAAVLWWINCELLGGLVISFSVFGRALEFHQQGLALLALPLLWLYRGKQGPYSPALKRLFWFFYPAHCLILALLALWL